MNDKIKKVICNYLVKDLYKVEIIYYRDSIWFIDRESRYWYFEYHKVDKHLWWRWSYFTQGLKIFSMDAEKEQTIFGELVNMILTKKQNLESKYPNKIFKTVGSVMNFEDKHEDVSKNEIKTTDGYGWKPRAVVDEVLNCEVKTTKRAVMDYIDEVDEVLNCEVETTSNAFEIPESLVDDVLNYEVEKTEGVFYNDEIVTQEVLDFSIETTKSGELIEEDKIMDDVLESAIEIEKIGHLKTHRLRPVTGALDYNDNPVEINSIEKLKGENPFQDIIVSHILDESDKVTDKLKIKEDDSIKSYGHDVYMCDHLVQNVLDVGVNSIHYDAEPHTQLIDGILKKV